MYMMLCMYVNVHVHVNVHIYIHVIHTHVCISLTSPSHTERNLQVDRALSQETAGKGTSEEMHMQPRLSSSMSHDVWRKKAITRSSTGTQIHIKLRDDCERVPTLVSALSCMYMYILIK